MPHVDITMIPGRDDNAKKKIALKVQRFLSEELKIDDKFVSVSIEDVPKEDWANHMERLSDKVMFVQPGVHPDIEFSEIAEHFLCADVLEHGNLTDIQKALVTLTALTASQTIKPLLRYTVLALDIGASPEEIKETLYQCAPYIGIEKVRCALDEVNKAFLEAGVVYPLAKQATVTEENRFEKGLAVQQEIFGAENINTMRASAPEELKHIQDYLSAYCFGDFYTRGTLNLKMRELITFCAICSLGGCEPQAKAHASANLSVGNTREMLIDAITQCLPFIGFPRTLNAITCINQVC